MTDSDFQIVARDEAVVSFIVEIRNAYLRQGANALRHWEQILTRMWANARRAESPADWCSKMLRSLNLSEPTARLNKAMLAVIRSPVDSNTWLDWLEREASYLVALARERLEIEKQREDD